MPKVTIKISQPVSDQIILTLSNEKIKYLLKFISSITDETEEKMDLLKEIEIGLTEARKICNGELPGKSIKQMINGK